MFKVTLSALRLENVYMYMYIVYCLKSVIRLISSDRYLVEGRYYCSHSVDLS